MTSNNNNTTEFNSIQKLENTIFVIFSVKLTCVCSKRLWIYREVSNALPFGGDGPQTAILKNAHAFLEDVHPCISVWYIYMRAFLYFWRTGYGRISWYFWYATLWPVTRLSCAWFLERVCSIGFCIREAYAVPLRRLCAALWTNNKVSTAIIAALQ